VGLGSDFDGAPMPAALADVAALPHLLGALRDDGFSPDEVQRIAWGNWRRMLAAAWGA
jgi:membrane dipeptidase